MARRYRKRKSRRPRKRRRRKTLSFNKQILGKSHACKLRYAQDVTITPQFNTQPDGHGLEVFSANGLYNTRMSSSDDHQPRGFDEMMALYHHYTVVGSKATVKFTPDSVSNAVHCGISVCAAAQRLPSLNSYLEKRNNIDKILVPPGNYVTIRKGCSPKKFLTVPSVLTNPQCQGAYNTNPEEEVYFHIYMGSLQPIASGTAVLSIVIEYAVVFSEPQTPAQS